MATTTTTTTPKKSPVDNYKSQIDLSGLGHILGSVLHAGSSAMKLGTPTGVGVKVNAPSSGSGSPSTSKGPSDPYAPFYSLTAADIPKFQSDPALQSALSQLPYTSFTDKNFAKLNPDVQAYIKLSRQNDWQKLTSGLGADSSGLGAHELNPMAVQMAYQNAIQPFVNQIQGNENTNISSYKGLMNQLLGDKNIPSQYKNVLQAQLPQNLSNMQMQADTGLQASLESPGVAQLMNQLQSTQLGQDAAAKSAYYQYITGQTPGLASAFGQLSAPFTGATVTPSTSATKTGP